MLSAVASPAPKVSENTAPLKSLWWWWIGTLVKHALSFILNASNNFPFFSADDDCWEPAAAHSHFAASCSPEWAWTSHLPKIAIEFVRPSPTRPVCVARHGWSHSHAQRRHMNPSSHVCWYGDCAVVVGCVLYSRDDARERARPRVPTVATTVPMVARDWWQEYPWIYFFFLNRRLCSVRGRVVGVWRAAGAMQTGWGLDATFCSRSWLPAASAPLPMRLCRAQQAVLFSSLGRDFYSAQDGHARSMKKLAFRPDCRCEKEGVPRQPRATDQNLPIRGPS